MNTIYTKLRRRAQGPSQGGATNTGVCRILTVRGFLLSSPRKPLLLIAACAAVAGCSDAPTECASIGIQSYKECADVLTARESSRMSRAASLYAQDAAYLRGYIDGKNGDPPKASK